MSTSRTVVILQEYIPQYRVPFFERLIEEASRENIIIRVGHGKANANQLARDDTAAIGNSFVVQQLELKLRGRRLVLRHAGKSAWEADLVIVEQARRNLDTYRLLIPAKLRANIALWGHGKDYTVEPTRLERRLQRALTSRASWFFGYTQGGVDFVVASGFHRDSTTVVQNSIDTAALKREVAAILPAEIASFSATHGLGKKTALFIGGLDDSKRIPFLIEAAVIANKEDPHFRLLIVGDGPLRPVAEAASANYSFIKYFGSRHGREKALVFAVSKILAMPGRVGLVAVDSFAAGIPIVTTAWGRHAPEFEYLAAGENAEISADTVSNYAAVMVRLLRDEPRLLELRANCLASSETYTLDSMVSNFLHGIRKALVAER
jgi:glycosyltransferase involved in cell wall biosynthesis